MRATAMTLETVHPGGEGSGDASPSEFRLEHEGQGGELVPIVLANALFNVITLSLYRFWARTRVRRYLWGHTSFLGDRIEYTGTGKELFLGFFIAVFVVILPLIAINAAAAWFWEASRPELYGLISTATYILVLFLIGAAIYRARRYRLSRTVWRGIRGGQTGSALRYGLKYLGFMVLNGLTAAWTYPWMRMRLMHQLMSNTWFGDRRFIFEGGAGPLYGRFALVWVVLLLVPFLLVILVVFLLGSDIALLFEAAQERLKENSAGSSPNVTDAPGSYPSVWQLLIPLVIVVIPMALVWYKAHEFRHMASCVRYEGLTFELNATVASLLWLVIGNFLIVALTLGFGLPFAQMRKFRYFCDRLTIRGQADFETIRQSSEARPGVGEGLAEAFDLGAV